MKSFRLGPFYLMLDSDNKANILEMSSIDSNHSTNYDSNGLKFLVRFS